MATKAKAKVGRKHTRGAGDVDKQAGQRLRQLRLQAEMSQEDLATLLNISFQQVQKYEKGANRLSVGRLIEVAKILKTTPHDIIGWTDNGHKIGGALDNGFDTELFKLAKAFSTLPEAHRTPVRQLINSLINSNAG